ncbi:MAG: hypothetical protein ABW157_02220 [Candidatus Thiodiazotropha sp. LLP2]
MNNKEYPEGFPLKPYDAEGSELQTGDTVKILHIPEGLLNNLDKETINIIKNCEGNLMTIYEIDDYGYMWVEKTILETDDEYESHSFSMEPKNLVKS